MTDQPKEPDVSLRMIGNVTIESTKVPTSKGEIDVPHFRVDSGSRLIAVRQPGETVTKAR